MKHVLVTGCSTGVGRAVVELLCQKEYRVTATVRSAADRDDLLASVPGNLDVILMDVTDQQSVTNGINQLISAGAAPDVLINNAGVPCMGAMEELSIEELYTAFDINVVGALRLFQAVVPAMRRRQSGQIINVSSALGAASLPCYGGYSATKFALEAMSEAMRLELSGFGVAVNVLRPGLIVSAFSEKKDRQRQKFATEVSPYASMVDTPSPDDLPALISTPAHVSETLLEMIEAPWTRFRWVCGTDSQNWLSAVQSMTEADFERYVRELGYGARPDALSKSR